MSLMAAFNNMQWSTLSCHSQQGLHLAFSLAAGKTNVSETTMSISKLIHIEIKIQGTKINEQTLCD